METTIRLRASEVPPGSSICVTAGETLVAVFNVGGFFHAVENVCLHRGGPVGEGDLDGTVVTCPWHGWQYDVTTGRNVFDPSVGLRTFPVEVDEGEIRIVVG